MFEKDRPDKNVKKLAEDNYVEAYANLNECACSEEHRLHVALAETRARPIVFTPSAKVSKRRLRNVGGGAASERSTRGLNPNHRDTPIPGAIREAGILMRQTSQQAEGPASAVRYCGEGQFGDFTVLP